MESWVPGIIIFQCNNDGISCSAFYVPYTLLGNLNPFILSQEKFEYNLNPSHKLREWLVSLKFWRRFHSLTSGNIVVRIF